MYISGEKMKTKPMNIFNTNSKKGSFIWAKIQLFKKIGY